MSARSLKAAFAPLVLVAAAILAACEGEATAPEAAVDQRRVLPSQVANPSPSGSRLYCSSDDWTGRAGYCSADSWAGK